LVKFSQSGDASGTALKGIVREGQPFSEFMGQVQQEMLDAQANASELSRAWAGFARMIGENTKPVFSLIRGELANLAAQTAATLSLLTDGMNAWAEMQKRNTETLGKIWQSMKDTFADILRTWAVTVATVRGAWDAAMNAIKLAWAGVWGFLLQAWNALEPVWRPIVNTLSAIWDGFAAVIRGVKGLFLDIWHTVQNIVSLLPDIKIPTLPSWLPGNWGQGKGLASGGIVTRPTQALIGEAGPEAVIPLSRGGMERTIIIQIGETRLAEIVLDLLGREIEHRLPAMP